MSTQAEKDTLYTMQMEALRHNEDQFRTILQHSSDVIVLLTEDGTITYASASLQQILGYAPAECLGTNISSYIHPDDSDAVVEKLAAILQSPDNQTTIECRVRRKNGSWAWIEATGSNYLHHPQIHAIVGNFHDITTRKQVEERQRYLNEASKILVSSFDHQITLQEIAQLIVPALADYCRIALLDEEQQIKAISVSHSDPGQVAFVQALYEQYKDLPNNTYGLQHILQTGQPELISNITDMVLERVKDNAELLSTIQKLGLQSYMGIPLIAREKVIGAMIISSIQPHRHYSLDDLFFAQELGHRLALMLDNVRLYREAQAEIAERKQIEQNLFFLAQASKILASSLDYQTTLANIAQLAVPHIADWCSVDMRTADGIQQLAITHVDPEKVQWAKELNQKNPLDPNAPTGVPNVLRTGQPEFYPDISEELLMAAAHNEEELALIRKIGFTSAMIVPLLVQGKAIGAISFVSTESGRHYTQVDLTMAEELASRAALAIENAHLYSQAQEAIKIRDDFISIASHELKTPITSLKMYTQVLQKQVAKMGEEAMGRSLAKMDSQLNKLTALIGDLLNVSKIERGQLEFQEEQFDLNELVKETVEQAQLSTKKHTIDIEGSITQSVWGDKDRIGQVLTNLLSNAIKYSPQADRVIVRLLSRNDCAVVSIHDFGIGIDKQEQNKIFDRFYRVSDPEEKTYPGLGIGLYLSHEIIQRHGGKLTVTSEKGKGSIFRFTLPYQRNK